MNKILFLSLILGCFIAVLGGRYDTYEFHDSHGRCWRCTSGDCVRCSNSVPRLNFPETWDMACPPPVDCLDFPGAKFPHLDISRYYLCVVGDRPVTVSCFCDTVFDMREQRCVKSDELRTIGCTNYTNFDPRPCS